MTWLTVQCFPQNTQEIPAFRRRRRTTLVKRGWSFVQVVGLWRVERPFTWNSRITLVVVVVKVATLTSNTQTLEEGSTSADNGWKREFFLIKNEYRTSKNTNTAALVSIEVYPQVQGVSEKGRGSHLLQSHLSIKVRRGEPFNLHLLDQFLKACS